MTTEQTPQIQTKGWDKLISAVKSPLGYAVFAALCAIVIIPLSKAFTDPLVQNSLVYSGLSLLGLSIFYVFIMSFIRPEALKGERLNLPQKKEDEEEDRDISTKKEEAPSDQSDRLNISRLGICNFGFFEDFVSAFPKYIESSTSLTAMFIHSRRWRENNNAGLTKLLLKERSKITVFLPDLKNKKLINELKKHFDDGDHLEFFISDAFRYFQLLKSRFPEKVDIRCFSLYPTYSLYKFDDTAIIAMYPTTTKRRSVPAFEISSTGEFWHFLGDDLNLLLSECKSLTVEEAIEYIEFNKT